MIKKKKETERESGEQRRTRTRYHYRKRYISFVGAERKKERRGEGLTGVKRTIKFDRKSFEKVRGEKKDSKAASKSWAFRGDEIDTRIKGEINESHYDR